MIKAYAKSDKGKVREINQDYFYIFIRWNTVIYSSRRNGMI